jgi:hypothetical protein
MHNQLPQKLLFQTYLFVLFVCSIFTIYTVLKPGISSPPYPEKLDQFFKQIGSSQLTSTTQIKFKKNSSDRTTSPIYKYSYDDGSKILATIVRVRKKDDFKIETYGLLTKNIDPIYLKNSSFVNTTPPSHSGVVGKNKFIQTCVIPGSSKLADSDFRLAPLTATVERLNPRKKSLLDRFLGTAKSIDYSCLVLTYQIPASSNQIPPQNWQTIVSNVQDALKSQ